MPTSIATTRELAATRGGRPPTRIAALPVPPSDGCASEGVLATLIDFAEHQTLTADSSDGARPPDAVARLYQIVWELEAHQARSLIESVLAWVEHARGRLPGPVRAEVAAMRAWLERHPR